jgi:hypothetical protein
VTIERAAKIGIKSVVHGHNVPHQSNAQSNDSQMYWGNVLAGVCMGIARYEHGKTQLHRGALA